MYEGGIFCLKKKKKKKDEEEILWGAMWMGIDEIKKASCTEQNDTT